MPGSSSASNRSNVLTGAGASGSVVRRKTSSIDMPNNRAILKASGKAGSYFPVSIALTVWRDTSR